MIHLVVIIITFINIYDLFVTGTMNVPCFTIKIYMYFLLRGWFKSHIYKIITTTSMKATIQMKLHKRITIQINKKERPRMHSTLLVTTHHQLFFMVLTIVPICTTSGTLTFLNYNRLPSFWWTRKHEIKGTWEKDGLHSHQAFWTTMQIILLVNYIEHLM